MATVGQTVRVRAAWTADDVAANPGAITALAEDPNGTQSTLSVSHDSTGNDHVEVPLTMSGRWWVRIVGTSPVPTAAETYIDVDRSPFVS